ncbi:MAG: hypothetical protein ABIZ04_06510 [Opitutus sp.]
MSDELPPPSLRLKPRARPEADPAVSGASTQVPPAAPIADAAVVEAEAPRLRLRPKLDLSDATAETNVVAASAEQSLKPASPFTLQPRPAPDSPALAPAPKTIEAPPAAAARPVLFRDAEPETPVAPEPAKFKLKEKTPSPVASVVAEPPLISAAVPPTSESSTRPATIPPYPAVAAPTPPKLKVALPPPVPKLNVKLPADEISGGRSGRRFPAGLLYTLAVLLLAGSYIGYRKYRPAAATATAPAPDAKPATVAKPVATAPAPETAPAPRPSTPSATLNEISAIPARAIAKAKATIAAAEENEQGRVEEATNGEMTTVRRPRPPAAPKPTPPATSTTQLAPGLTATTTAEVAGDATPAFRNWVAQARISGVFKGTPPRVLINGRTTSAGQMVDELLEITFDGIDPLGKSLIFRDRSGATVLRKF